MAWENAFLDHLAEADIARLAAHLEEVQVERNAILDEVGRPVGYVYLPIDCILSVVTVMKDGSQVESRTIGCEAGYGLLHSLGSPLAYERMLVQVGGRSWRMPTTQLRAAAAKSPALTQAMVRHAQATILQSALATACNTLHSAEQRLCRWLLLTRDRLREDVLPLTQEHLAIMLGVQRTTVTAVASQLQARGYVSYSRGRIRLLQPEALERCACECYETMRLGSIRMIEG